MYSDLFIEVDPTGRITSGRCGPKCLHLVDDKMACATSNKISSEHMEAVLNYSISQIRRVAPWCSIILVPSLRIKPNVDDDDQNNWKTACGYASLETVPQHICISLSWSKYETAATVHHELWHICERYLPQQMRQDIHELLCTNAFDWNDASYWDLPSEVSARWYESWVQVLLNGGGHHLVPGDLLSEVAHFVYSGGLAAQVMASRQPEPPPPPLPRWKQVLAGLIPRR